MTGFLMSDIIDLRGQWCESVATGVPSSIKDI